MSDPSDQTPQQPRTVAISGASGMVGRTLAAALRDQGGRVLRLVRGEPRDRESEVYWDSEIGLADPERLAGIDGVVHLAGESIMGRWTSKKKARIRDSRVQGTRLLCEGLARLEEPPKTLITASAIGYYGDRGDERLDEKSPPGTNFLAGVCRDWEQATEPAQAAGVRVANLRIGVVLSRRGGALAQMLTPFKLGLGGVLGSGNQHMSWIALDELVGVIQFVLTTPEIAGPINAVSPNPVTNRQFTKTLGKVLRRPTIFPMPAFAARVVFGQMADELLLASARVEPRRLLDSGYPFSFPELEAALRHALQ